MWYIHLYGMVWKGRFVGMGIDSYMIEGYDILKKIMSGKLCQKNVE